MRSHECMIVFLYAYMRECVLLLPVWGLMGKCVCATFPRIVFCMSVLFQEFRPNSIDPLAPDATFAHSQLGDGDIVIVQLRCEEDVPGVQAFCSEMRDTVFLKIRELGPDRSL